LNDAGKVHAVRKQRNLLAHEAGQSCTWQALASAIADGHAELQYLGMVGPRPAYEFFGERSGIKASARGHKFAQDYVYGLKDNGRPVMEVKWTVDFGGDGVDLSKPNPSTAE
jgi:hypothetical protein